MVLTDPSLVETFLSQVTIVAGAIVVIAAAVGIFWKWFVRDRWELAVSKVANNPDERSVIDHIDVVAAELKVEMAKALSRIESLERKIENGLMGRIATVEKNSEELIKGVARIEGIIQMLTRSNE